MAKTTTRTPWAFVPSLYFQQGLPVILVQQFSVLMYKKLGVPNEQIALWTSLLTWPWILKMLWGPLVDSYGSKRSWVRITQVLIAILLFASAYVVTQGNFLVATLLLFVAVAFLSATHDIALDGYYLLALPQDQQAFFLGIRSTFFRLAMIFCTGALVLVAGFFENRGWIPAQSWQMAIVAGAAVYSVLVLYGFFAAPKIDLDRPVRKNVVKNEGPTFVEAFKTFFTQKGVVSILLFILLYRFGESMLSKMSGLFLLDKPEAGGLGLSTTEVGWLVGNLGVISLVVGGISGGIVVSKFGLRRCLWPMALALYVPNLMYLWAAHANPSTSAIAGILAVDQFGYGFGMASYMVFAMSVCQRSKYQTSHYAIATGVMALGAMCAGILAGYAQKFLGYPGFFLLVCLCAIPGIILLRFIPLNLEIDGEELAVAIRSDS